MGPDKLDSNVPISTIDSGKEANDLVRNVLAADMFSIVNGYALAQAIFAFSTSALYEAFKANGYVVVSEVVANNDLEPRHAVGLMRYLVTQGIFRESAKETFHPTPKGSATLSQGAMGWLTMVRGGYGNLMERATEMLNKDISYRKDIVRNGYYTAVGSCMTTGAILDPVPYEIATKRGWKCIGDLGCGAGQFLIGFAGKDKNNRGVGIDVDADAIKQAKINAEAAGVADQLTFIQGDAFELSQVKAECSDVEVFYSFGFEHELFRNGENAVVEHIDGIGSIFPGTRYLLGEPMVSRTATDGQFYWAHILSEQGLPRNIPGWTEVLGKLTNGNLREVFVPDHRMIGAFFDIEFK